MSKPLICCLGPKPTHVNGEEHYDWLEIAAGESVFAKLGDRLPEAFVTLQKTWRTTNMQYEPAHSELSQLPGFAVARWLRNGSKTKFRALVQTLQRRVRAIYYISDHVPCFELQWARHLTFDEFYDQLYEMQEAYFFFDAALCDKRDQQSGTWFNFEHNVWPHLAPFRGFVQTFMHVVSQDMTPELEQAMFAMVNGFSLATFANLKPKPMQFLFEQPNKEPPSLSDIQQALAHIQKKVDALADIVATQNQMTPFTRAEEFTAIVDQCIDDVACCQRLMQQRRDTLDV